MWNCPREPVPIIPSLAVCPSISFWPFSVQEVSHGNSEMADPTANILPKFDRNSLRVNILSIMYQYTLITFVVPFVKQYISLAE